MLLHEILLPRCSRVDRLVGGWMKLSSDARRHGSARARGWMGKTASHTISEISEGFLVRRWRSLHEIAELIVWEFGA